MPFHGPAPMVSAPAHVLLAMTPHHALNNSLSTSPFNASVLSALSHQQSPVSQVGVEVQEVLNDHSHTY